MATRKSARKKAENWEELAKYYIQSGCDPGGFEVKLVDAIVGRGVFTTKVFSKNQFLLEYRGDLVTYKEGVRREIQYEEDLGSFLYFFSWGSKKMCIDATLDPFDLNLGKMVNDSPNPNCVMRVVMHLGTPHLCLFAAREIEKGEELRYDYGETYLPWRETTKVIRLSKKTTGRLKTYMETTVGSKTGKGTKVGQVTCMETTEGLETGMEITVGQETTGGMETRGGRETCMETAEGSKTGMETTVGQETCMQTAEGAKTGMETTVGQETCMETAEGTKTGMETTVGQETCMETAEGSKTGMETTVGQETCMETAEGAKTGMETTVGQETCLETAEGAKTGMETTVGQETCMETAEGAKTGMETTVGQETCMETAEGSKTGMETTVGQETCLETAEGAKTGMETTVGQETCMETAEGSKTGMETTVGQETCMETAEGSKTGMETTVGQETCMETAEGSKTGMETTVGQETCLETAEGAKTGMETTVGQETCLETAEGAKTGMETTVEQETCMETAEEPRTGMETTVGQETCIETRGALDTHKETTGKPETCKQTTWGPETTGGEQTYMETRGGQEGIAEQETRERQETCVETTGRQKTHMETTGRQETHVETTGRQETHVETTGRQGTRVETTGRQETHVETTGRQETHVETTGRQETHVETTGGQETHVETTGRQEARMETTGEQGMHVETRGRPEACVEMTCLQKKGVGTQVETTGVSETGMKTTGESKARVETASGSETFVETAAWQVTTGRPDTCMETTEGPKARVETTGGPETRTKVTGGLETQMETTAWPETHISDVHPSEVHVHLQDLTFCGLLKKSFTVGANKAPECSSWSTEDSTCQDCVIGEEIAENSCSSSSSEVFPYISVHTSLPLASSEDCKNVDNCAAVEETDDIDGTGDAGATDNDDLKTEEETTASRSTSYPYVTVPLYESSATSKRSYDKRQACYFCSKLCSKMARHLRTVHKEEIEIARILAFSDRGIVSFELERYRLLGNFNHNLEVLRNRSGMLLVSRRSRSVKIAEDYLPCIHCYGFIDVHEIWRHVSSCPYNKGAEERDMESNDVGRDEGKQNGIKITTKCRMLLAGAGNVTLARRSFTELQETVLDTMRSGQEKNLIEKDNLILVFGSTMLAKKGKGYRHTISSKLRQLARLLIEMRKIYPLCDLSDCLCGSRFDDVVQATKAMCGKAECASMQGVDMMSTPSLALHIGHSLAKVIEIKNGQAIRQQNQKLREDVSAFKELFEAEWTDKVSSQALNSLKERKFNKEELLPLTSDLLKLTELVCLSVKSYTKLLQRNPMKDNWMKLSRSVFVAVTLFNRRRGGEVARMHLSCFTNRPNWIERQNKEMLQSLNQVERKLLDRFDMIQLPGKRNRRVPMILKPEWVEAMNSLVETRQKCQIKSTYFFAIPGKMSHIHPWKVLHDYAVEAECQKPQLISSTRLRKYTATVSQLLSLSHGETEWLSNHLGHQVEIHKDVYRQHESTVELTKISKILLAVEQGQVSRYKGKTLQEIDIDDIELELFDEEDKGARPEPTDMNSVLTEIQETNARCEVDEHHERPGMPEADERPDDGLRDVQKKKLRQKRKSRKPVIEESDSDSNPYVPEEDYIETSCDEPQPPLKKWKRNPWTSKENEEVEKHFQKHIKCQKIPKNGEVNYFLKKSNMKRSLANVKSRVQYFIKKL